MKKLLLSLAIFLTTTLNAVATEKPIVWEERTLGKADAPITITEYASLGCSHCANFHANTFPDIKKNYIEIGKAKFIFRDFSLDPLSLQAAQIARCLPEKQFFGFIGILFKNQKEWINATGDITAIKKFATQAGMTDAAFKSCLDNKALNDALLEKRLEASNTLKVESTPTFFINGEKMSGDMSFENFEKKLNAAAK
jgi:protein-disulfide isomerase